MNFQIRSLVAIYGATGEYADKINGTYNTSSEISNGAPIYVKDHDSDVIIEYWFSHSAWQIKFVSAKGKDFPIAYIASPSPIPLDMVAESSVGTWRTLNKAIWTAQTTIHVVLPPVHDVAVVGAEGPNANVINGRYSPQIVGEKYEAIYRNSQNESYIEYCTSEQLWQVKAAGDEGIAIKATVAAHLPLPLEMAEGPWLVAVEGGEWEQQTGVGVVVTTSRTICIIGATGDNADYVNGTYQPTDEIVNGGLVYVRHGRCIEYWSASSQWQLKHLADRGTDACLAFLPSPTAFPIDLIHKKGGGVLPWKVAVGSSLQTQDLTVVVPSVYSVCVSSASGLYGDDVNGLYDPTLDVCDGAFVYKKRDRSDIYIEYSGDDRRWLLRSSGQLFGGEDSCFASLTSPQPLPLEQVQNGIWKVFDGSDMAVDNSVRVAVTATRDVTIDGCVGSFAGFINGDYRPAVRVNGTTFYAKSGESSVSIVFEDRAWRVTLAQGADDSEPPQTIAFLPCPTPTPIETVQDSLWAVFDGTSFRGEDKVAAFVKIVHSVRLSGASGPAANALNGLYSPVLNALTGDTFYVKKDGLHCIEYWWEARQWQAKRCASKGQNCASAYLSSRLFLPLELVSDDCWKIGDGQKYRNEPSLRASAAGIRTIMISGAEGSLAAQINGRYDPTDETHNDATLYLKQDDQDKCIEWLPSNRTWQIKPISKIGQNKSWARLWCESALPLDYLATDRRYVWQQYDKMGWGDKPNMAIVLPSLNSIRIFGAVGPLSSNVNGTYDPSPTEVYGGASVYYKRPHGTDCIEYLAERGEWQVKPVADRGSGRASAFLPCPKPAPIEQVLDSLWMVHAGDKFQVQPQVKVLAK